MSIQKKRLFVGGLNSGTSEQDIRERFKTFGSVSSVELHKVVKKEGFLEKTFAYVDIESSDSNVKRCISMLTNTKWRGGILKIEPARESFLSRLQKEREESVSQKAKLNNKECSPLPVKELPKQIPSAVPGTLIPGQKNWVIGKFGRALPVVHMRQKHGHRILKFDPSKTVHNLKRIKDGHDDDDKCVSELTWNLEERTYHNRNMNDYKNVRASSSPSEDDSDHEANEKKIKFSKKKRERRIKDKRNDSDGSSEDLPSINSEEAVAIEININSIDSNGNENKVSKTKHDGETMANEKLNSKRKRKSEKDKDFTPKSGETFESVELITNGDDSTTTERKGRKKQEKKLKGSKKMRKSETESDDSLMREMEEQDVANGDELSKTRRKEKQKANETLDEDSLDEDEDIPMREICSSPQEVTNKEKNEKSKRKERKKKTENEKFNEDSLDKNEGDVSMVEIASSTQKITNEKESEKKKRKDKKKRKENSNKKTIELSVDKDESVQEPTWSISMSTVDETLDTPEEVTNEQETGRAKRKENKKRKEKLTERDLDTESSDEKTDFTISSGNKERRDETAKEGELDENTSSVDHVSGNDEFLSADSNNNEQIQQEDNDTSETNVVAENMNDTCNGVMERESKVKKKKKKRQPTDKQSDILEGGKSQKKKQKKKKENSSKKLESNAKRLQAIKERETNTNIKQSLVASALQNLDKKDQQKNPKHITFDDDEGEGEGEENDEEKQTSHEGSGKISGSTATNWLGLDSDSDDSNDDATIDEQTFNAKPQFEGKAGQKLFKLQKSYRGDSRFQLDERFVESVDESDEEHLPITSTEQLNNTDIDVDDDESVKKQLSQEKSMAMSVLRGILGENFGSKFGDSSARVDKFKDSNLLRYDPTKDEHAHFEQKPKKDDSPEPTVKESQQPPAEDMPSVPEVTQEKYYDVKTDALTAMFGEKKEDKTSTTFTFLSNQNDPDDETPADVEWGEAEVLQSKPWNPVMLPYDSSGDEDDGGMIEEEQQTDRQALSDERFFFHFGDPELESTVYDQETPFMRTETLEQLNQHWVNVRSELTQDYKKKHKDALRRNSKMAAKRARMR